MASLIKNQILKHLSKFTKNLSPDKVHLSALKGEAELLNLVLDENVLTDVLELPSWIQLTKAVCNKVTVKIQWTKLKSTPIVINLNDVVVEMEACNELRDVSLHANRPSYSSGGTYRFSDKVVDGMTVIVSSVTVNFKSPAFIASAELSKIRLESRTPAWKRSNLQMTRLKDTDRGEVLIFKELDWQLLKIEVQPLKDGVIDEEATPLRLITNPGRCRITIKKKLANCSVVSCRLVVIMDNLLWVLTDSQLHQAFAFINTFSSLVKESTELSQKVKGVRKFENSAEYLAQANQMSRKATPNYLSTKSKVFSYYDVVETSYHMYSSRIDLNFCDETTANGHKPSLPELENGGTLQILLTNLSLDYYPYHLANGERKHWLRYNESITQRKTWVQGLMNSFHQRLVELVTCYQSRTHTPLHRAAPHGSDESKQATPEVSPNPAKVNGFNQTCNQWKHSVQSNLKKLMSSSFIFRLEDLTIYKVTTGSNQSKPSLFLSRSDFVLPQGVSLIHLEHTTYYYPGGINFPVLAPNLFVNISPLQLAVDVPTILWLNSFGLGLERSTIFQNDSGEAEPDYLDIRVEALMPTISIKGSLPENQPDRPCSFDLQASRVIATNCRDSSLSSRFTLAKCLNSYSCGAMFFDSSVFPAMESDYSPVPEDLLQYTAGKDAIPLCIVDKDNIEDVYNPSELTLKRLQAKLSPNMFWVENKSVWSLYLDPFWAEFITIGGSKKKPMPFLDAFPLTLWIYTKSPENPNRPNRKLLKEYYHDEAKGSKGPHDSSDTIYKQQPVADTYVVAYINSLVNIQLNHYQFIFLMRTVDMFAELTDHLLCDTLAFVGDISNLKNSVCFSTLVPQVHLSILVAVDDGASKNMPNSRNSSSIDLSLGQDRVRNTNDNKCSSESQETSQSGSGARSLTDIPETLSEGAFCKPNHVRHEEAISDVIVNLDCTYTPSRKHQTSDDTRSMLSYVDENDAMSIKSDISSDSEQYVMVDYENHPVEFALLSRSNLSSPRGEPRFEVANEIKDDADVSSSIDDEKKSITSSDKRNVMFQVLNIVINDVQVIQQSRGVNSAVKVACNHLNVEQGDQQESWHSFQELFSARGRTWKDSDSKPFEANSKNPTFKLRLENGPDAANRYKDECISRVGHLSLTSSNLNIKLRMSLLTGLLDLIEDEVIPEPPIMPMRIRASCIQIHLDEDRPPVNVTSPGPIPLDLSVHESFIYRDSNGVFHIEPKDETKNAVFALQSYQTTVNGVEDNRDGLLYNQMSTSSIETVFSSMEEKRSSSIATKSQDANSQLVEELQEQNDQLTYKLMSFTALEDENAHIKDQLSSLKAATNQDQTSALENARVMMKLLEAQDEIKRLEIEKKSLMATMQLLQKDLESFEGRSAQQNS